MKEKITLNNGKEMPMIGYGVYQIPASITERCVHEALESGYKLIDTTNVLKKQPTLIISNL